MKEIMRSCLKNFAIFGIPILVAGATIAGIEMSNYSERMRNYYFAIAPINREYFGDSSAWLIQNIAPPLARYATDALAGLITLSLSLRATLTLSDRLEDHRFSKFRWANK